MFNRILIANRGEIACRIIRTCRRMGIETVAVYSDADEGALHVASADQSRHIGSAAPSESYLVIERVLEAALDSGAEAIHPGFGFLSENAGFVDAVNHAGLVFIGPPASAVLEMGDKIRAKAIAESAGVSVVPGWMGEIADSEAALQLAQQIGYPVMIKPALGGGGKGMRVAYTDQEVLDGYPRARSEASQSFGSDRLFLEKFIESPRHIEIQLLADQHGNCVWLNERECSIQRRHQKVIEEAPSPLLDGETRRRMGEQACALAKAVDYHSAGTVEFVCDPDRNFYFLEMNTRLQVEHPVTEMTTGLDLVEEMIRIAAGEPLSIGQDDVALRGWSIEARIYAENPRRNFLPSIGRISRLRTPKESSQVRIDTGVVEGSEVTIHYDPMIAKLVVHGDDRGAAIKTARQALDGYSIEGVAHNIDFLASILREQDFVDGVMSTSFIEDRWSDGFENAPMTEREEIVLTAVGVLANTVVTQRAVSSSDHDVASTKNWVARFPDRKVDVTAELSARDTLNVVGPWGHTQLTGELDSDLTAFSGTVNGDQVQVQIRRCSPGWELSHSGITVPLLVLTPRVSELFDRIPKRSGGDQSRQVFSPMPGRVVEVHVCAGESVEDGTPLITIDAMKMENVLRAERTGTVAHVAVEQGDFVAVDALLVEFAEETDVKR